MTELRFEWDEAKNLSNQRKHGISFQQATQAFYDPLHLLLPDRDKDGEQRWKTFGLVDGVLLLLVVHTVQEERNLEEVVRIISARLADRHERRSYEDENG